MESDLANKLSALRNRTLERDDESDPEGRIYRHKETGDIYYSVTRILSATMPEENKKALERWLERPGSLQNRDMAATRGTAMHNNAEYILKTAQRLARSTANKRNSWRAGEDGLYRAPKAVTRWALEKAIAGAPKVPWSASGFARGLRGWILDHVTAIHSIEFSVHHHLGFAGSADGLVDLMLPGASEPVLAIVDWKSTGKIRPRRYGERAGGLQPPMRRLRFRTGSQNRPPCPWSGCGGRQTLRSTPIPFPGSQRPYSRF